MDVPTTSIVVEGVIFDVVIIAHPDPNPDPLDGKQKLLQNSIEKFFL